MTFSTHTHTHTHTPSICVRVCVCECMSVGEMERAERTGLHNAWTALIRQLLNCRVTTARVLTAATSCFIAVLILCTIVRRPVTMTFRHAAARILTDPAKKSTDASGLPLCIQPSVETTTQQNVAKSPPQHDQSAEKEVISCFTDESTAEERQLNASDERMLARVFEWSELITTRCKRLVQFGGQVHDKTHTIDGEKFVCLDPTFSLVSTDNCLVYSFGIGHDWSFDEAMTTFGCQVYAFDPSIDNDNTTHSPAITFHQIGVGGSMHTNVLGWSILTLDQIMQKLGHTHHTVHFLKMDVEGYEFDVFAQQLREGRLVLDQVEQIGIEIHLRLDPGIELDFYRRVDAIIGHLTALGFRLAHWQYNHVVTQRYRFPGVARPVSLLYELLLMRSGPDTFDRSQRGNLTNIWL